jgi:hypothetical protein
MAPVEADIDNSVSAKRNLRIIFLHSGIGEFRSRAAHGVNRDGFLMAGAGKPQRRAN